MIFVLSVPTKLSFPQDHLAILLRSFWKRQIIVAKNDLGRQVCSFSILMHKDSPLRFIIIQFIYLIVNVAGPNVTLWVVCG